jgi:hypothetical protein
VVQDEFGDDAQAASVGFLQEMPEVRQGPHVRMDLGIMGYIVSVIA